MVDHGSTDETPFLLANFQSREPRLTVIRQAALGIVSALQKGCEVAQGRLIARMDADDVMHPHRLARQFDFLQGNPLMGLVSCLVRLGGSTERQAGYAAYVDWINSLQDPQEISLARFVESPVAHPSVLFRREMIAQYGGYRDGDFPEDLHRESDITHSDEARKRSDSWHEPEAGTHRWTIPDACRLHSA